MALTKRVVTGLRSTLEDGRIRVRTDTVFEEDGVEASRIFHSKVIVPGQDVSQEPEEVQRTANAEWIPAIVAAYKAAEAARMAKFRGDEGA